MPIPDITHLQFLVLTILMDEERPGRYVREKLKEDGYSKSAPAFYQFMSRLEDGKLVEGRYEQKVIDGQVIKERVYKITGAGMQAWREVRDFYLEHANLRFHGA